jgi:AmmeMemoRadiSam system protein B
VLCLRDPSGLADRVAFLPPAAATILSFCDGKRTPSEVVKAFRHKTGATITTSQIESLLGQLDEALLLDTPRFHAHVRALHDEFRATPTRIPSHAGGSYPADAAALKQLLDGHVAAAPPAARAAAPLAGLVSPHIDFPRGGPVYGRAFAALSATPPPDLVIIFGTDHNGIDHPFTLTRKAYDTPLGLVETDADLVDAIARAAGDDGLFADEFHHRAEHSIEFQAVWLRQLWGEKTPPCLPVLCGSLHASIQRGRSPRAENRVNDFLTTLSRLTEKRRVLVIAGADLAHVGPRFGDDRYGANERAILERADRDALAPIVRGDAEGFFASVARERDRFRVCGLSPIFSTLSYLGARRHDSSEGEVLDYAQCPADDHPASFVSITAVTLPM